DVDLFPTLPSGNVSACRNEVRQVQLEKGARPVTAVFHLIGKITDDLGELRRLGGRQTVRKTKLDRNLPALVLMNVFRQPAHIVGDGSKQIGRRPARDYLELRALDFVREGFRRDIHVGGKA